jgi:hypothetical protein
VREKEKREKEVWVKVVDGARGATNSHKNQQQTKR